MGTNCQNGGSLWFFKVDEPQPLQQTSESLLTCDVCVLTCPCPRRMTAKHFKISLLFSSRHPRKWHHLREMPRRLFLEWNITQSNLPEAHQLQRARSQNGMERRCDAWQRVPGRKEWETGSALRNWYVPSWKQKRQISARTFAVTPKVAKCT